MVSEGFLSRPIFCLLTTLSCCPDMRLCQILSAVKVVTFAKVPMHKVPPLQHHAESGITAE